jgi:cytochrome P450
MAYNASIAEQFEVIQRWLTGGNSSGVSSSQPDPFLGVPQTGEPTVYRVTHGDQVIRIDLGDQPLSRLEWGLYAFVPSIDLLKTFDKLRGEPEPVPVSSGVASNALPPALPEAQAVPAVVAKDPLRAEVKEQFEDDLTRGDRWKRVCQRPGGVEPIGDTVIVGGYEHVMQVLNDKGITFSASGYGKRMEETLGRSPFGLDNAGPHAGHEDSYVAALKSAITTSVTESAAFIHAHGCVAKRLTTALAGAQLLGLPAASVDVAELGVNLIADLCQAWFGVKFGPGQAEAGTFDPKASVVRCPGDFLVMARKVFSAYPNGVVEALATAKATSLRKAVADWVSAARASQSPPPVMASVLGELNKMGIDNDEQVGIVANVMLGLPATLLGTWVKVLMQWTADRRLWSLQHELSQRMPGDADHTQASKALLDALIFTMAVDPVADGIWRTVQKKTNVQKTADQENVKLGEVVVKPDQVIWLGLGAALSAKSLDRAATADLLFGGTGTAPHACPGRYMATGALLGALAALLQAGTWSATASPTVLSLSPSQAPSAPAPAPAPADSPCSSV